MVEKIVRAHRKMLAEFFAELEKNPGHFHPHPFNAALAELIANYAGKDLYYATVEVETGKMVAYGMLRFTEPYPDPSLGIAVSPCWRGRGLGTEMMEHLVRETRGTGAPFMTLFVDKSNPAVRLYQRFGFVLEQSKRDENEWKGVLKLA